MEADSRTVTQHGSKGDACNNNGSSSSRASVSLWLKSHALLVAHVPGRRGKSGRRSDGLEGGRDEATKKVE
jgi:hypothetical protein